MIGCAVSVTSGLAAYNTQILFAYNSNHMEGSTLSLEQTSQLYDTGALLADGAGDRIRADDVVGTRSHFRAFSWILDHADEPVDRAMVCALHAMLGRGTGREFDPDRNVGGYKVLPNVVSQVMGVHTVLPADVPRAMGRVFALYRGLRDDPYGMALAHWMFETTHPFSDGNGRVGRLVMFKELLRLDAMSVIVRDADRNLYVRGLDMFDTEPGFLVDTLLAESDWYEALVNHLAPERMVFVRARMGSGGRGRAARRPSCGQSVREARMDGGGYALGDTSRGDCGFRRPGGRIGRRTASRSCSRPVRRASATRRITAEFQWLFTFFGCRFAHW